MFVPVVAHQCSADRLDRGMAAHIAVGRQYIGIALARYNRSDNPHTGRSGDFGDDVVKLQVHPIRAFCMCWIWAASVFH